MHIKKKVILRASLITSFIFEKKNLIEKIITFQNFHRIIKEKYLKEIK
jgi:hypothetical protein